MSPVFLVSGNIAMNNRFEKYGRAMVKHLIMLLFIFIAGLSGVCQDSLTLAIKSITAGRLVETPVIDGVPDAAISKPLPSATGFIEFSPYNGKKADFETDIRFGYNEEGLYAIAIMYDPHPDSIQAELGNRDLTDELNTDFITIDILPYNDGLTMFEFKITPAGLQGDTKYSAAGREPSWDAVWESAATIADSGWIAEVFIPYSALRFPRTSVQTWGINIWRNMNRYHEMSTWTYVPNDVEDIFRYYGTLTGMEGIKPPVRLSFTPYLGGYIEKQPGQKSWNKILRGGMDLKYGINQSYTLDMELIPDFGQVQSDDIVLNLSPFEIRYDEKRQFFTEATEMFRKCDIFYSRRIGGIPKDYDAASGSLQLHEILTENPELTQVINATKISGRNSRGLGLGVFNGMTSDTRAKALDTVTGKQRNILTQPFTNYNVLVIDQNLKNNSYLSFINTNYWSPEQKYNSNVTGGETKLVNSGNTFAINGILNLSQIHAEGDNPQVGTNSFVNFYRPSGVIRYSLSSHIIDQNYDHNDMGYLERNNETSNKGTLSYNIYDPVWRILSSKTTFEVEYNTRFKPFSLMETELQLSNYTTWNNFWQYYLEFSYKPFGLYDFYEPRVEGWYYHQPPSWEGCLEIITDARKKLATDFETSLVFHPGNERLDYILSLEPRFRISDRFTTSLSGEWGIISNDYGWVETQYDTQANPEIFFGRRAVRTVDNTVNIRYVFTTSISMNLRARHYWSKVEYSDFYLLNSDGCLDPADYDRHSDIDFNVLNLDLQLLWFFAPGSQISVMWKNSILTTGDTPSDNYFTALEETVGSPQTNSLSLRILYYLDYSILKKMLRK